MSVASLIYTILVAPATVLVGAGAVRAVTQQNTHATHRPG
jgi:hypothetical protein